VSQIVMLLAVAIGVLAFVQVKKRSQILTKQQKFQTTLMIIAVVLVLLALTGRAHWITAAVGAVFALLRGALPSLVRMMPILQRLFQEAQNRRPASGRSRVVTQTLVMWLDQNTGEMDGEVLSGEFKAKKLSELSQDQCHRLMAYCHAQDHEAAQLFQAYLARRFNSEPDPNQSKQSDTGGFQSNMDRTEALQILGLGEPTTKEEIEMAHRKLMQKLHPDRGGTDYLASKLNQAKQTLLA
jgi:hypothetical protein